MPIELSTVTSGYNLSAINNNFQKIEDAWDEKLDRLVSSHGNQMEQALDMNSNRVLNAGAPINQTDLVRLQDLVEVADIVGVIPLQQDRQFGDGISKSFDAPHTTESGPQAFFVNVDGITKTPVIDYSSDVIGKIDFTTAPGPDANVDILWFEPKVIDDPDVSTRTVLSENSTTYRPLEERFSDVINVKDYGAIGDGVTDDTDAINAAIAACNNGTVIFPKSKYLVNPTTSRVFLKDNITIDLMGSTILIEGDHYVNGVFVTVDDPFATTVRYAKENVIIKNGTFEGQSTPPGAGGRVPTAEIENLFFIGSFSDSVAFESNNFIFDNLNIKNINGTGISVWQSEKIKVTGCNFENIFVDQGQANGSAVGFTGSKNCIINSCTGVHNATLGDSWHFAIAVSWVTGTSNIVFSNNVIKDWNAGHLLSVETNDLNKAAQDVIITGNIGENIPGGAIANTKGANRVLIDGNNIKNCSLGISGLQSYGITVVNNTFEDVDLTCVALENCYYDALVSNNTMKNVGISGDTSDANGFKRGIGIYYVTTGTESEYEPDSVVISSNIMKDVNGAGIFVSRSGGNTSMRGLISSNLLYNVGTQSSGAALRSLVGIFGLDCHVVDNYIKSNDSTTELAISGVFNTTTCVDNTIEGTYTLGYFSCSGKSIWNDTNYFSPSKFSWDGGKLIAFEDSSSITLGSARAPYDSGDIVYYNDPQTAGYIGAVRMTDGITAGGFNSFGALVAP
jgi:hypothetical protein